MPTYTPYYALAKPLVNSPVDEDLWGSELNDNMDIIDTTLHDLAVGSGGAYVVTGTILDFAGTAAPSGYLMCFGQAVDRTTYADLFDVIGTVWGVGDGSTTFNVPDLRGRIGAGKDDMGGTAANRLTTAVSGVDGLTIGAVGGAQSHTLTISQIPAHDHTYQDWGAPGSNPGWDTLNNPVQWNQMRTTSQTGGGSPHNNVQPTAVILKIIKT